jgi:hypothetical protein
LLSIHSYLAVICSLRLLSPFPFYLHPTLSQFPLYHSPSRTVLQLGTCEQGLPKFVFRPHEPLVFEVNHLSVSRHSLFVFISSVRISSLLAPCFLLRFLSFLAHCTSLFAPRFLRHAPRFSFLAHYSMLCALLNAYRFALRFLYFASCCVFSSSYVSILVSRPSCRYSEPISIHNYPSPFVLSLTPSLRPRSALAARTEVGQARAATTSLRPVTILVLGACGRG